MRSVDDISYKFKPDAAGVSIDKIEQTETAPKCLHEFIDGAIRHQFGIFQDTFDTAVCSIIKYYQLFELVVCSEWIFDDGVAIGCEDGFKYVAYF